MITFDLTKQKFLRQSIIRYSERVIQVPESFALLRLHRKSDAPVQYINTHPARKGLACHMTYITCMLVPACSKAGMLLAELVDNKQSNWISECYIYIYIHLCVSNQIPVSEDCISKCFLPLTSTLLCRCRNPCSPTACNWACRHHKHRRRHRL